MKITKTELKKIIQEELQQELNPRDGYTANPGQMDDSGMEFEIGDEVDVLGSVLAGAVAEVTALGDVDGRPTVVLRLLSDPSLPSAIGYKRGDEVLVRPKFLEKRTDLFAQRMGRKAENPRRGPKKYYGIKDV